MNDIDFGNSIEIRKNEPLYKHSSFRIGGNAEYALFPSSREELIYALNTCRQKSINYIVVGNASNILFDDKGFEGAVIFTEKLNSTEYIYKNDCVFLRAECGKTLTELSSDAGKKHCLTGLEFAYGIPGTVGGAIYMNAGAYGGQMSDIVVETEYYDIDSGKISTLDFLGHDFGYRHSIFADNSSFVVISTLLKLKAGNVEQIYETMKKNMSSRKEKQPLEFPNAGSTFKRPGEKIYVGKLIEDAGLKGFSIGGAQISEKHAGFIINRGGATSNDVISLIEHVKTVISEKYGINLECEVIRVPYK